jgi:anaerobic selenocysteine-containing dehydrogenase
MRKVVDPLFEARTSYDIFAAICERMGTGKAFTEGATTWPGFARSTKRRAFRHAVSAWK